MDSFPPSTVFDGYASEELEHALSIQFTPIEPRYLHQLRDELQGIACRFGTNAPEVCSPRKGVLPQSLQPQQKDVFNAVLWPQYAEGYAEAQSELLTVPIAESRDRMTDLFSVLHEREAWFTYSKVPLHPACEPTEHQQRVMWMRSDVAHSVALVFRALNDIGLMAHVEDCWRPPKVQKGLFLRRVVDTARGNTHWSWQHVKAMSSSLTAPAPGFAGHQAGTAVDWVLRKRSREVGEQTFLDEGNVYPEGGAVSSEHFPYLTFEQFRTRLIFLFSARMGGFKTLPTEHWHMSRGDRGMVGHTPVHRAIYGPIKNFSRSTGEVEPYDPAAVDQCFFTDAQIERLVILSRQGGEDGSPLSYAELLEAVHRAHS